MGGFFWGIPRKLIKRITEIEIDTHYYDNDVIPSAQTVFTYDINKNNKTAEITGFVSNNIGQAVIPYRIQYGESASHMFANVITLKNGAFKDNQYLTDITIPNTIDIIPKDCFKNDIHLIRVNIPKSVKTISTGSFQGCTDLKSLFIPYTVNEIQPDAFKDCPNLKIICYKHSVAEEYAKTNNIPYSLISYTLDDDITKDSENLVTSGVIYAAFKKIYDRLKKFIDDHINNKVDPHDNAAFKGITINNSNINKSNVNESIIGSSKVTNSNLETNTFKDSTMTNTTSTDNVFKGDTNISKAVIADETVTKSEITNLTTDKATIKTGTLTELKETADSTVGNKKYDPNSLVNKQYVDDNDNKNINKSNVANIVYGTDNNGNQDELSYSTNANNNAIVQRDSNGNIKSINDITKFEEQSLVSKKYVDSAISEAIEDIDFPEGGNGGGTTVDTSGLQPRLDNNLSTNAKTISGSINELNDKVNPISAELVAGWNTISLNKKYPISWQFLSKPFCYTPAGQPLDFTLRNFENAFTTVDGNEYHSFDINVAEACILDCATTAKSTAGGVHAQYFILKYFYTGNDGKDLDTLSTITNESWPLDKYSVGYGNYEGNAGSNNGYQITNTDGTVLVKFGGDNTGGGTNAGNTKFYESLFVNVSEIKKLLPNEDVEIVLNALWYSQMTNGNINVSIESFIADSITEIKSESNIISIVGENVEQTYTNPTDLTCNIAKLKNSNETLTRDSYVPVLKITLHHTATNYMNITLTALG